ncbi:DUF6114 domain-containing protein [Amycolatopsis pigmentata]|uniref:DUF6114 domain-containing protein n=1 Tax=Amycolatopsis pigmentata TaxID=450801 RepID=A0ABW5G575_9PSEU
MIALRNGMARTVVSGSRRGLVRCGSAMASGWRAFRRWRHGRPVASAVLLALAGLVILLPPYMTFRFRDVVVSISTLGGLSALVLGSLLLVCAVVVCVRSSMRVFAGAAAILLSLVALITANLGGFLIGTVLGLVGGALCLAWTDQTARPAETPVAAGVTTGTLEED